MSETMLIPPPADNPQKRLPTVYFIDDSATMREVIKIAFRRENIHVITCADAQSAMAQFEQNRPDVVITDVIMPDKDGYTVCSEIKQHADYSEIPVVLMSGVVNKTVADKAVAVRADELIRKPFQPQELILRVKSLLQPKSAELADLSKSPTPSAALNQLFAPTSAPPRPTPVPTPASQHSANLAAQPPAAQPLAAQPSGAESAWPRALADAFIPRPAATNYAPAETQHAAPPPQPQRPSATSADTQKLRAEITFLDTLIKKLQTELQNERQYNQSLEAQIRALTSD
jgi:DNA-binding response OmpR family regulator